MVLKELYDKSIKDNWDVLIKAIIKGNIEDIEDFLKEALPGGEWIASDIGETVVGFLALHYDLGSKVHEKLNPVLLGLFEDGLEDLIASVIPLKEWIEKLAPPKK